MFRGQSVTDNVSYQSHFWEIYSMTQEEPFPACFCLRNLGASQTNNDFLWILHFKIFSEQKQLNALHNKVKFRGKKVL